MNGTSARPAFGGAVIALLVLAVPIGLYALAFPLGDPAASEVRARLGERPLAMLLHTLGGGVVLVLGALQFSARLRLERPALHRLLGRTYATLVVLAGGGGLWLALNADGGPVARIGFALLAILWLVSIGCAWQTARRRQFAAHRRWMMRNYALTFGAVMLRVQLPVLIGGFGLDFSAAYPVVAWLAWVPNLVLVEWWLAGRPAPALPAA